MYEGFGLVLLDFRGIAVIPLEVTTLPVVPPQARETSPAGRKGGTHKDCVAVSDHVWELKLLQAVSLNMSMMVGVGPFIAIPLLFAKVPGPLAMLA